MPSSSRRGSSSSKEDDPPPPKDAEEFKVPVNGPAGAAEEAAADPMSKDMKGIAEEDGRGGWNGAAGKRRCWTLGLDVDPPEGKTTGGIAKSFVIFFERSGMDFEN